MSFPIFHPVYSLCSGLEVVLNWSMLNFLECFIVLTMRSQCTNCEGYLGPVKKNVHLKKAVVFFWYKSESSIQEAQEDVCAARLDDDPGFSI